MINCRWLLSLAKKKKKRVTYIVLSPFFLMVNKNKKNSTVFDDTVGKYF